MSALCVQLFTFLKTANGAIYRPARIRQNIRDHVDSPSSPLIVKTNNVTAVLGYPVFFDPEWSMLWETLKPYYPDPATFIPKISGIIIAWCDAFIFWLENEDNEKAVERVLDILKGTSRLNLLLEVGLQSLPGLLFLR
jgi:hypothetical protein